MTGPSMMNTEIVGKRMQLLKEVVPGLVRVAVLVNSFNPIHAIFWRRPHRQPASWGSSFNLSKRAHRGSYVAFDLARRSKAGALIALDDALTYAHRTRVVALTADSQLPALYGYREFTDEGGLMSYGADLASHYRHAADYVDKICGSKARRDSSRATN